VVVGWDRCKRSCCTALADASLLLLGPCRGAWRGASLLLRGVLLWSWLSAVPTCRDTANSAPGLREAAP
jgi:hypothetical protein